MTHRKLCNKWASILTLKVAGVKALPCEKDYERETAKKETEGKPKQPLLFIIYMIRQDNVTLPAFYGALKEIPLDKP